MQYTTAFEEGMTGDGRGRRKRKPTLLQDENQSTGTAEANLSAARKKKKASASSKNNAKNSSKTTTSKNANNKKRGSKTAGNTNGKKKSKVAAATASDTTKATIIHTNNTGNGIGMFERHKREFERCLLRLQKLDVYNFFSDDDVPPEYDECYESNPTLVSDENATTTAMDTALETSTTLHASTIPSTSSDDPMSSSTKEENDDKETNPTTFSNHPPYNFVVLRKRLERGRYILDRQRLLENEENFQSDGTKSSAEDGKRHRSPSFSIQHPIGIDWELFRNDVVGMCDSAVDRNSGNFDDGTPGTLSNTAEKIKTTLEQIHEKTGRRQSKEMELSNDAHRFTNIIEAVENREAALQGRSWRKKGESYFYNKLTKTRI